MRITVMRDFFDLLKQMDLYQVENPRAAQTYPGIEKVSASQDQGNYKKV